jgi:hypothetical protein
VFDLVGSVDEACVRLERLMSDDLAWQQHSQRVLAHHREHHSIEATVGQYEREFTHLARKT